MSVVGAERGGGGRHQQIVAAAPEGQGSGPGARYRDHLEVVGDRRDEDSGDIGPPTTTIWRETELTASSPRCNARTTDCAGLTSRAAPAASRATPAASMAATAASRAAPAARVRSMVNVTVPGRRTAATRLPDPVSATSIPASAPASGSSSAGGAVSPSAGSATAAAGDSSAVQRPP